MPDCANCGAHMEPGETDCSTCHMTSDSTASFEPVGAVDVAGSADLDALEGPVLIVRKGPQHGERFYLDRPRFTLGRDPGSDIFLNDLTVSRAHAVITAADGNLSVQDSGSLNGTYLNGVCIDEAPLSDGDVLQVGTFQMVFHEGGGDR